MKFYFLIIAFLATNVLTGQITVIDEYFENGKKFIKEQGIDADGFEITRTTINGAIDYEVKTKVEDIDGTIKSTVVTNGVERVYYEKNGIEVGIFTEFTKNYGRYFKVLLSIVNNSNQRVDFVPDRKGLATMVKGLKKNANLLPLSFDEYTGIVEGRQAGNALLMGVLTGVANMGAGYSTVNSTTSYSSSYGSGYISTSTTFYSPALARMETAQNMETLARFSDVESGRLNMINEGYIKANTIRPGEVLEGYFLIPYKKKVTEIDLRVMVGEEKFMFTFPNPKESAN